MSIFHEIIVNMFCHLKLEIELAIPALNEWQIEEHIPAAQVLIKAHLTFKICIFWVPV